MASTFKDHFSGHAQAYAQARPSYPADLYHWLVREAPAHTLAWDCATGNGQAAIGLAGYFQTVIASDASAEQIANADRSRDNVSYEVFPAEQTTLADASVDLVTVAQALHWFDHARFFREVNRVLKPGGIFAAWCYTLHRNTPAIDAVIDHYYQDVVGPYWPPERVLIESGYRDIAIPLVEIAAPVFSMQTVWSLEQVMDYLDTWSATKRYITHTGQSPLPALRQQLQAAWGDSGEQHTLQWPLYLRVGRKYERGNTL